MPLSYFTRVLAQLEENARQKSRSSTEKVESKVASSSPAANKVFFSGRIDCHNVDLSCAYSVLGVHNIIVMWQIAIDGAFCKFTSEI